MSNVGSPHPMVDLDWIRLASGNPSLSVRECLDRQDTVGPNILFDVEYYRQQYGRDIPAHMSALEHFCRQDETCLRNPNALFSTQQWLEVFRALTPDSSRWREELVRVLGREAAFSRNEYLRDQNDEIILSDTFVGKAPAQGDDICLFVHYDRHDQIQPYVVDYLKALKASGVSIVFLSNTKEFSEKEIDKVRNIVWRVVCTDNKAYDWGLFRQGMKLLEGQYERNPILIANDSVTYLGRGLDEMIAQCRAHPERVTGAISAKQHIWHMQSFFLYCGKEVVRSRPWKEFWNKIRAHDDKWFVINANEFGFSRWMADQNVPMYAIWNYDDLISGENRNRASKWRDGVFEKKELANPTVDLWDILLEHGFPFLKNSILKESILAGNIDHLCNIISALSRGGFKQGVI